MEEQIIAGDTLIANRAHERRRYPRVEVAWGMTLGWGSRLKWPGQVVSLGPFGVKVQLGGNDATPPRGSQVRLEFTPPDQRAPLAIKGLVWRVDPDGLAIALLNLSIRDFHRLKTLVDQWHAS